ncbi:MAG: glycine zipper family protein [Woeseiaceae bacterium]|nr:glycine zipper family protein [Woeseiaceae bacterium]
MQRLIWVLLALSGIASANEVYVFPANDQTVEQQAKDEFECYQWAAERTGFDPVATAQAAPDSSSPVAEATSSSEAGGAGKAAVSGAAKGAVIAEVSDGDAGKGAATGATLGLFKGKRQKQARQEQEQMAAEERARIEAHAKQLELRSNYARANAACLEGRGYVVK